LNALTQQVFGEIGNNTTKFIYKNSDGESLENLHSQNYFNYSAGYRTPFSTMFYGSVYASFTQYGMYGSDQTFNNYYAWDVKYIGIGIALDADVYRLKKFSFLVRLAGEPQFLINGTQQINEQVFSIKGVEQFDRPFLFAKGGLGINYCADGNIAVSAKYMYGRGFPLGKSDDNETLQIASSSFSLGLTISLKNCKYCQPKHFN
jgi:hypothetical protein